MIVPLFLLLARASLTVDAACNTNAIQNCYKTYFKALELPDFVFPPTPDYFIDDVIYRMTEDADHFTASCNAYNALYKCIGSTSDCINYENIVNALSTNNETAAFYVGQFFGIQYVCGHASGSQLNSCSELNIDQCEKTRDVCGEADSRAVCISKAIRSACGNDLGSVMCNYFATVMKYSSPCSNELPDCSQLNSGTVFGIQLTAIFASMLLLFLS